MENEKSIESMTLEELNLYSAKLYDQFYATKGQIKIVQQWRNRRSVEADAEKRISEARAAIENAVAPTLPAPIVVEAESIESDEAVIGMGGSIKKLWKRVAVLLR